MNFDYTYITLFGFIVFEPMTIVTNLLIFIFSIYCFAKLSKFQQPYSKSWAWFVLLVGLSSCFGSTAHAVHFQLGKTFFDIVFYIMNALSICSIYFCFKSPYLYYSKEKPQKLIINFVIVWVAFLLFFTLFQNNFLIVKIHAGIVLIYSLLVHLIVYTKTKEKGSALVVLGISISLLSIIVHSFKFSIDKWFNYKDISHIIILISLIIIYTGIKTNTEKLESISLKTSL